MQKPFYRGQIVLCVKAHQQGLVKYQQKYEVVDCFKCGCGWYVKLLGIQLINIFGFPITNEYTICDGCGQHEINNGLHPFNAGLFVAVVESPFPSLTFAEVVLKESKETCLN